MINADLQGPVPPIQVKTTKMFYKGSFAFYESSSDRGLIPCAPRVSDDYKQIAEADPLPAAP